MTWADLRRAAVEQAALAVLADREADEATRRDARGELERGETSYDNFSADELDVWIDLSARGLGHEVSDQYAHGLAVAWQRAADQRRDEYERVEVTGPRPQVPGCKRCREFEDCDLQVLREACAEEQAEERILDGAKLALPESDHAE